MILELDYITETNLIERGRAARRKLKSRHNPIAKKLRDRELRQRIVESKLEEEKGGAKNLKKEFEEGRLDDI